MVLPFSRARAGGGLTTTNHLVAAGLGELKRWSTRVIPELMYDRFDDFREIGREVGVSVGPPIIKLSLASALRLLG